MFSHIFVGITDFDRALSFYDALFEILGVESRFCERDRPWAGWQSTGQQRPYFVISKPHNGQPHEPGNGQMVAFMANTREAVRQAHARALKNGGTCEGPPGLRPEYHAHYYGAYFRDPDGNKLCVVCHRADDDESLPEAEPDPHHL